MTQPTTPEVECERLHPGLAVADLAAAVAFYTEKLGFTLAFTWGTWGDPATFAGVNLGAVQLFLEGGSPGPQRSAVYFVVGNADELFEFQRANGVEILAEPNDREWGLRDYTIKDLDGHRLTFGHYIYTVGDPVEIERVVLTVRMEKRLAAVLKDLADFKRMSLSSCLEETLLHTFEPYGDGVASPHTKRDLRYIQELKQKHAIDYDTHASYRFVERKMGGDA